MDYKLYIQDLDMNSLEHLVTREGVSKTLEGFSSKSFKLSSGKTLHSAIEDERASLQSLKDKLII